MYHTWKDHRESMRFQAAENQGPPCRSWIEFRYHSKYDEKLSEGFEEVSSMVVWYFQFIFVLPCRD